MSTALRAEPSPVPPPPYPVARFTVEQYHRMIASGALTEDDRIELLDGWMVEKLPKGPAHEFAIGILREFFRAILAPGWHVRSQAPVTFSASEPEPDLTIVRGDLRDYRDHHPGPEDVGLVIEITDSSLKFDRRKAQIYAAAGVPEYWIVNLEERTVEVRTGPGDVGYRQTVTKGDGDSLDVTLKGQACGAIRVAELLP